MNNDQLRREKDIQNRKIHQLTSEKNDLVLQIETLHREFDIALSVKQAEIEKLQQKLFSNEQSSNEKNLKKKLEMEIPYRMELESKDIEMEKMKDFGNCLVRENESLKTRLDTMRFDWESELRNLKNRHRIEINELKLHLSALQPEKEYEKTQGEVIREKNREIEDLKKKLHEKESMITRLRKEKTEIMDSNFAQYENLKKILELEKLEKRNLMIEKEKVSSDEKRDYYQKNLKDQEDIIVYYERRYENKIKEKEIKEEKMVTENKEIREKVKIKEEEIKGKEEKLEQAKKEMEKIELKYRDVIKEKEKLVDENLELNEKIKSLKEELEGFSKEKSNCETLQIENEKSKEKIQKYKEKLKLANEKIMGFLEDKMKKIHKNSIITNEIPPNLGKKIENEPSIMKTNKEFQTNTALNQRQEYPLNDINNLKIIEGNRILRENAIRFTQNLKFEMGIV